MRIKKYFNKTLSRHIALIFGILLIVFLIKYYDPVEIISSYKYLSLKNIILSSICIILSTLIGSFNLYIFLYEIKKISFLFFLKIYWLSWAFGLIAPGQIGDVATIGFLLKKKGLNYSIGFSRSVIDKIISLFVVLCFSLYGIIFYFNIFNYFRIDSLVLIFILLVIICYLLLIFLKKISNILQNKNGILGSFGNFINEISFIIKNLKLKILVNILITFIKIILIGSAYWYVFAAIGHDNQSVLVITSLAALAGLVAYLPISLNGIGTVEVSGVFLFGKFGIPSEQVLAAYLLLRLMVLMLAWIPSFVIIFFTNKFIVKTKTTYE
jgi:uncharacterized protein (TIRG00374 family)